MNIRARQFCALFFLLFIFVPANSFGNQQSSTVSPSTSQNLDSIIDKYKPLKCGKSKSPLFKKDPSDFLELELISDFKYINTETYSEEGGDSGILSYIDKKHGQQYVPVFIKDRGNSRRDYCEWVPLRITFDNPNILKDFEKSLKDLPSGDDKLVHLYNELKVKRKNQPLKKGIKQKGNIFRKTGGNIKVVTHCGKSSWKRIGGDTREQQEKRLLQEYYIYQILDQLKSTTLKTHLAEITYKDPEGKTILTRKAFFREPIKKMAKRCGLLHKGKKIKVIRQFDETSAFQLDLYNKFIYSNDYEVEERNTITLYRTDGQKFLAPYDFDLSGIIVPDYRPNSMSVEQNLRDRFQPWLQSLEGNEMAIVQIFYITNKKEKMRKVLTNSLLNEERKKHMLNWFDSYMEALELFLENNRGVKPNLIERLEEGSPQ